MKKIITLTLLILLSIQIKAQHCGFDFASIIVLNIHTKEKLEVIPNLKIELIGDYPTNFKTKTLKFEQNLEFPFIKDYYGLVIPNNLNLENFKIKITDIDGFNNQGAFGEIIIDLFKNDKYDLCGNYNKKNFVSEYGKRLYQPIEVIHSAKKKVIKSDYKKVGIIKNSEIIYKTSFTSFNSSLPENFSFYIKEDENEIELFNIEVNGAYIGEIDLFKVDENNFIYIRLDETSGIQYGKFYFIDVKNKTAKKVIEDFGNFKIPDNLENFSGFGILKNSDNKFYSGLKLRSKNDDKNYHLKRTHKLVLNEKNEFVLKVVDNKITKGQ
jgi:hypothetical protein